MTYDEIEIYRRQLQELIERWRPTEAPVSIDVTKGDFYELARKVGASTRAVFINPQTGLPAGYDASIDDVISNIHQALQTASMVDACRTAAKNHEIAMKAQRNARFSQWIALGAMLAPWGAVAVNLIGTANDGSWSISVGASTRVRDWIAFLAIAIAVASLLVARRSLKYQ